VTDARRALVLTDLAVDQTAQPPSQAASSGGYDIWAARRIAALRAGRAARGRVASLVSWSVRVEHLLGDGPPGRTVGVKQRLGASAKDTVERVGQCDGILDAKVHALPAGGAVHMGGITGQKQATGPIGIGHAVMNAKLRPPDHI
jgi:hypothetical protein